MKRDPKSALLSFALSDGVRDARRALQRTGRALRRSARTVDYFHRVDDPRSWLAARVLERLVDAYGLEVRCHVVPEPAADVDPEPQLRSRFAREDTRRLAAALGEPFPSPGEETVAARVRMANAIALGGLRGRAQLARLVQVSTLLLTRDGERLAALADDADTAPGESVRPRLEAGYTRLREAGYYDAATVAYEGEVYPGVERFVHLERRLVDEGLSDRGVVPALPMPPLPAADAPLVPVEVFVSFRSPYSYVGLERIAALAEPYRLALRLRPIYPMVMRGLPVPTEKRLYIVGDAKRQAAQHGIAFGRIHDPLGPAIPRCLGLAVAAAAEGLDVAFARAALRASFAEGLDLADEPTLRTVARRAGLPDALVESTRGDESHVRVTDEHREALYDRGLWGVPSFVVGDEAFFGQDRIPLVLAAAVAARG